MTEPIQTAGAAIAAASATTLAAAPTVATLFGVPLELLVWGAIGGMIALIYSEPRQPPLAGFALVLHAAGRLFSASILGALLSRVALAASAHLPGLAAVEAQPLASPAAAVLVGVATALIPDALRWARGRLGGAP